MTKSDRIGRLQVGQQITLTLNNLGNEVITGTIESLTTSSIRVRTFERTISVSRDPSFITRLAVVR